MNDNDEEQIDPGHGDLRRLGRVVGPVLFGAGALLTGVGMISFFSAMGSFEPPRYFWCCFLGMPLMALGGVVTKLAFLGSILRYFAGEAAPVQKDTFNYLAKGIRPGVKDLAQAVSEGISTGLEKPAGHTRFCVKCGAGAATQAIFCASCGQKLD